MSDLIKFDASPEVNTSGSLVMQEQQRAIAEVQASMLLARQFPRDQNAAYNRIMNACKRPTLATQGLYTYTRGGTRIEGLSIRAAEMMAQCWGNIDFGFAELSRGIGKDGVTYSEVQAIARDNETGTSRSVKFQVRHWRDTRQGGYQLKDERDIYELIANMASRRMRSCILAIIPGDIQDAATEQLNKTLAGDTSEPIQDRVRKMVTAFSEHGVTQEQLETRIGHKLESVSPAELANLAKIFTSIRDGIGKVEEYFSQPEVKKTSKSEEIKEKLGGKS